MERLSYLYASALFDLALESGDVGVFLEQTILVRDTLMETTNRRVLVHPHISAAEKQALFCGALNGLIDPNLLGLLFLVTDKNREVFLIPALTALIDLIESYMKKATAKVSFATALDENQIAEMQEILSGKLGKTVEIALKVDPSIIGGPYIYVDGYYIDWTVKARLRDLTVHMKEGWGA